MNRPVASTSVAINGADIMVGSILKAVASIGIVAPTALAQAQMTRIEMPTVMASGVVAPQRRRLAPEHAPEVAQADLSHREAPHDRRDGLRARVSARADQERDEEGERHDLGELGLEVPENGAGQSLGCEEQQQPEEAGADVAPR